MILYFDFVFLVVVIIHPSIFQSINSSIHPLLRSFRLRLWLRLRLRLTSRSRSRSTTTLFFRGGVAYIAIFCRMKGEAGHDGAAEARKQGNKNNAGGGFDLYGGVFGKAVFGRKHNSSSNNTSSNNSSVETASNVDDLQKQLGSVAVGGNERSLPGFSEASGSTSATTTSSGGGASVASGSSSSSSSGGTAATGSATSNPSPAAMLKLNHHHQHEVSGGSSSSSGGGASPAAADALSKPARSVRSPSNFPSPRSGPEGNLRRTGHFRSVSYDSVPCKGASLPKGSSRETTSSSGGNAKPPTNAQSSAKTGHSNAANSPFLYGNILPTGTAACRSVLSPDKGNVNSKTESSTSHGHVLGSGTGHYGHGSVIKGNSRYDSGSSGTGNIQMAGESMLMKRAMASTDAEDVKNSGNDFYKRGHFAEALVLYDRAISLSPSHAPYRSNKAAALTALGRLSEAVQECHEAIKLDPSFARAHHRLASLYLKLGQVENARRQFNLAGQQSDRTDFQRLQSVEKHLMKCVEARSYKDWHSMLKESDDVIIAGADSSPVVYASKAEALLKLERVDEAEAVLLCADKGEGISRGIRLHGIAGDSYTFLVRGQLDMALGRFEKAVAAAEKSVGTDASNHEACLLLTKARAVANARSIGNDLYKAKKYAEACIAYCQGLQHDPLNPILLCNRAACRSALNEWEKALEDCNQVLSIRPNYFKAIYRRAICNYKLARWDEAVKDFERVIKECPGDKEAAEFLMQAQAQLKMPKARGEAIHSLVETISTSDQFRHAISLAGPVIFHFSSRSNEQCRRIAPFFDQLCEIYSCASFLQVDVEESPVLASLEGVSLVPMFKIYKNGIMVKEMFCPSQQVLEDSVKYHCLN